MSIPTPEQARQLVEHFGSQRAAAQAVGSAQAAVWSWLHPERARQGRRASDKKRYWAENGDREKRLEAMRGRYADEAWMAVHKQRCADYYDRFARQIIFRTTQTRRSRRIAEREAEYGPNPAPAGFPTVDVGALLREANNGSLPREE